MTTVHDIARQMLHSRDTEPVERYEAVGLFFAAIGAAENALWHDDEGYARHYWRWTDDGLPDKTGPSVALITAVCTDDGFTIVHTRGIDADGESLSGFTVRDESGEFVDFYREG